MRLLKTAIHPDADPNSSFIFHRQATRAIVLNGENILMLYTQRYFIADKTLTYNANIPLFSYTQVP
jgi:hypothetical protein